MLSIFILLFVELLKAIFIILQYYIERTENRVHLQQQNTKNNKDDIQEEKGEPPYNNNNNNNNNKDIIQYGKGELQID